MADAAKRRGARKRIGELFLEAGLITTQDLEAALNRQRQFGGRVGSHLIGIGVVTETVLLEFLSRSTGYPSVDLDTAEADDKLRDLISREVAEKHFVVPVRLSKDSRPGNLTVAMADPTDLEVVDRIQFSTGCSVEPVIATEAAVQRFIKRLYELGVRSTRRDDMLEHIEVGRQGDGTFSSDSIPFAVSRTSRKRPFTTLAELLIAKGVITRDELFAKMRQYQNRGKE